MREAWPSPSPSTGTSCTEGTLATARLAITVEVGVAARTLRLVG